VSAATTDTRTYQMLIDGEWGDASDTVSFDSVNPRGLVPGA